MYTHLFEKGKIGTLEIKNRIVMPAMGGILGDESGFITKAEIAYYEARARGGTGLIVSAACTVAPELCGLCGSTDMTIPGAAEHIKTLMDRIHWHGSKMILQLAHLGRQGDSHIYNNQQPVAPSALKENDWLEMPRELTNAEVKQIVDDYVKGAKVAFDGGADGVELHGAHGYLIHQFMSPRANKRADEYGGSFENRMRFVTEITEGIKKIKPENTIISIRLNAKDGFEGGMTIEDCIRIAKYMEKIGVDCIDISQGTYTNNYATNDPSLLPEGCRTEQIKLFKAAVKIPVIAVNNIKRPSTADQLLADGVCDFVGLGRPLLCDPEFGIKAANGEPETIRTCIGCNNCHEFRSGGGRRCCCSLNPYLAAELLYNESTVIKSGQHKNAVVIGAGPGGMNAAEILALKGFKVILLDKNAELGGSLILASKATGKDKVQWTIDGYAARLAKAHVDIRLNSKVDSADDIKGFHPSVVVVAVGGNPINPQIPGVDLPAVKLAHDVLKDSSNIENRNIAIVGSGMTGLETAEVLLGKGNKISMYDMLDEIAKGAEKQNRFVDMTHLEENGVNFYINHKAKEITDEGVIFENLQTGQLVTGKADLVILSLGINSNTTLESLSQAFDKVVFVGDCVSPGKIVDATSSGLLELWDY